MVTLTGQRLGEYDIGAFRFRTPMFVAYTGRHRESGIEVAFLHGTPRSGVDFAKEVARLKAIRRPELPLILGWGNIGFSERVLVTAPLGEALWSPGAPRLEWINALSHLTTICDCFEVASDAGLYHGGLTPECIRTSAEGAARIVGLGVSRLFAIPPSAMVEQARFLAPEQFQKSPIADEQTDIYALGMCLYSMLVGHLPFPAADGADLPVLARHGAVEPIAYREIPLRLNSLVRPMTAKERRLRLRSYADVRLEAAAVFVRASKEQPDALKLALANADMSAIKDPAVRRLGEDSDALLSMFAPSSDDEPGSGPRISGAVEPSDAPRAAPGARYPSNEATLKGDDAEPPFGDERRGGAPTPDELNGPVVEASLVAAPAAHSPANHQLSAVLSKNRPTPVSAPSDPALLPSGPPAPRTWTAAIGARRWLVHAALLTLLGLCFVAEDNRNDTSISPSVLRLPCSWTRSSIAPEPSTSRQTREASDDTPARRALEHVRPELLPVGRRPERPNIPAASRMPAWSGKNVTAVFELDDPGGD